MLNDRGLELEPSDILKARVIARIDEAARSAYTELWEDLEDQSGRKGFNELLGHVRMIYRKEKARRSQLDEFEEYVVKQVPTAEAQNYDFATKKTKYFQSKSGVSPYASTTQVLSRGQWSVAVVEARQQELLDVFRKGWQLG